MPLVSYFCKGLTWQTGGLTTVNVHFTNFIVQSMVFKKYKNRNYKSLILEGFEQTKWFGGLSACKKSYVQKYKAMILQNLNKQGLIVRVFKNVSY